MKVLVVEDDPLLQVDLAEMLELMGHEVVGPFSAEAPAIQSCDASLPDAAFVDFNLGKNMNSSNLARRLFHEGVQFAFLTAHGRQYLPRDLDEVLVIEKPYTEAQLEQFLGSVRH
ncbi:hypothetical protein XM53_06540 [Roseovarius atlanticus]|uniref:Response regulatory domain-containing protein n=1 Tax=Roseovarius atlanticus TaxID=1641875 RepID=A0A0T5NX61_9RHOB|nr:response regulator [Roseovarius atlanticus]KRS13509.1 hypothetical protein XM53_06540 [Roseovarius atlanticus]